MNQNLGNSISLIWSLDSKECEKCLLSLNSSFKVVSELGFHRTLLINNISEEGFSIYKDRFENYGFDEISLNTRKAYSMHPGFYIIQNSMVLDSLNLYNLQNDEDLFIFLSKYYLTNNKLHSYDEDSIIDINFENIDKFILDESNYYLYDRIKNEAYFQSETYYLAKNILEYKAIAKKILNNSNLKLFNPEGSFKILDSIGFLNNRLENLKVKDNVKWQIYNYKYASENSIKSINWLCRTSGKSNSDTFFIDIPEKTSLDFSSDLAIDDSACYVKLNYLNGERISIESLGIAKLVRNGKRYQLQKVLQIGLPKELLDMNIPINDGYKIIVFKDRIYLGLDYYPFVYIYNLKSPKQSKWFCHSQGILDENDFQNTFTYLLKTVHITSKSNLILAFWHKGDIFIKNSNIDLQQEDIIFKTIQLTDNNEKTRNLALNVSCSGYKIAVARKEGKNVLIQKYLIP